MAMSNLYQPVIKFVGMTVPDSPFSLVGYVKVNDVPFDPLLSSNQSEPIAVLVLVIIIAKAVPLSLGGAVSVWKKNSSVAVFDCGKGACMYVRLLGIRGDCRGNWIEYAVPGKRGV